MNDENEVRKGIQQAKIGDTGLTIVACQIFGGSYLSGHLLGSATFGWLTLFISTILVFAVSKNEKASLYFSFLAGILFAIWIFASFALGEEKSLVIGFIASLIGGTIVIGGTAAGLRHLRDIG